MSEARPPAISKDALPSRHVTEGLGNAFHRVFYYAMGLSTAEIHQPHVGVVTAWDESLEAGGTLRAAAESAKDGVWEAGGTPREFTTIAGQDERSVQGAGYGHSLVARELIADSVELTVRGHSYDALLGCASSDVALAGLAMAALRLDIPTVLVWCPAAARRDGEGAAEAAFQSSHAFAMALETLGLRLPEPPALVLERVAGGPAADLADGAGAELMRRVAAAERPRARIAGGALPEAAEVIGAVAGGCGPLLHLLALANEAGADLGAEGAVRAASVGAARRDAGVALVRGSLAPAGALAWATAGAPRAHRGPARAFDGEDEACAAAAAGCARDELLVVRGQGPRTGPGVRDLVELHRALLASPAPPAAVVTDGRISALPQTVAISAVTPEAGAGPLGAVVDGDEIELDLDGGLLLCDAAGGRAPAGGEPEPAHAGDAVLWKYARLVGPAMEGALTHPGARSEPRCYADL